MQIPVAMNFHDTINFLDAMNFQKWEHFLAHPVYFDKTEKCLIPLLGNSAGQTSVDGKVLQYAIKVTHPFSITVNRHAFHSFRVRNHAATGLLGHCIIATAPAVQ